ncbi:MAG: gephyrin-like molybdotransferase Glp [Flavobacteriales bacterium]
MITVSEARQLIQQHSKALPVVRKTLKDAVGFVLAEDVISPINTPPFDQSAMDGYAFRFADWTPGKELILAGEVAAGDTVEDTVTAGSAYRIFTGAPVPAGADTVVMQEKVALTSNGILINDNILQVAANVRPRGSETQKGELAMSASTLLTPAAIGYLANLGFTEVIVHNAPRISVIITGKELQQPGSSLPEGKVYESNSYGLSAALKQQGLFAKIVFVGDEKEATKKSISEALQQSDLLLLTGGISVGDYDFVNESLSECNVEKIFHKIKQKPGKPLYFGRKDDQLIFGLPGNPAAVLTCFYEYVLPCLRALKGEKNNGPLSLYLPLGKAYSKKKGLTHFIKGRTEEQSVLPLGAQESYKLNSFSLANCIIELEEEKENFEKGELVKIHLLP